MRTENIFRITAYAILTAIAGLLYWFFHSQYLLMAFVALLAAPVFSVLINVLLKRFISVQIQAASSGDLYGRQYEEAFFYIDIKNPSPFLCLDAKLDLTVTNDFFGTEGKCRISVPIRMVKGYSLTFPVRAMLPGLVTVRVEHILIKDMLGLCTLKKKMQSSATLTVLPREGERFSYDRTAIEVGMLESEESSKRGNDFSDVQEIREYIPGDKLMSIHWKLSAKRDILMVKDRVSMSDQQLVIVPELVSDHLALEQILAATYQSIQTLVSDGTTVRFLYWSVGSYDYVETRIDYRADLDAAFARMFYEKTYEAYDEAAVHMQAVHPEMKAFLHITMSGGNVICYLRET